MAITFVDYADVTAGASVDVTVLVPVGVSEGDMLVVGIGEYNPAVAAAIPPDIVAWSRMTTYHPGYPGKQFQVYVATYDSATMGGPGDPLVFTDANGDIAYWAAFIACYHADNGFQPAQWCFNVPGAYYAANAPATWAFQDWFDSDPATTPYGPYDVTKTDIYDTDLLLYVFGIMTDPAMIMPPEFRPPGAAALGDPPPPGIEFRGWESKDAPADVSVVVALCDEYGVTVTPGVDARDWDFTYSGSVHTVGLLLREGSGGAGGFICGFSTW